MSESIAAVVVTFNRRELLTECLNALLQQTRKLDRIYVIDQASTDGTAEILQERGFLANPQIEYWCAPVNTGGSGGFHDGVQRAQSNRHSWIWIMDDDSIAAPDACEEILPLTTFPRVVAVANHKLRKDGTEASNHIRVLNDLKIAQKDYVRLKFSSFVGLMVKLSVVDTLGLPKYEFFTQYDDSEYCARLLTQGDIAYAPKSVILHKEVDSPDLKKKFLIWSFLRMPVDRYWRTYFIYRNRLWFIIHAPGINRAAEIPQYLYAVIREVGAVLLLDRTQLFNRLSIVLRGVRDALLNRFDNEYPFKMRLRM
jgi:rhamnopyranosyl-N-acetylglucosaminyl-diphospho-decaprenol beta-1,3/1,4-galactofuranosyltransferase